MTRMRIILMLTPVFCVSVGFAQTARDYFFPARDKNLSVYYTSTFGDNSDQKLTKIYVKDYGDSALITTQSDLVVRVNNTQRPNTWEQAVKISRLEITALRGKAKTQNGLEKFDNSGEVLFKIPAKKSETVEWSSPIQNGAIKTIYRSEFTTVKVDGKKLKAVKVSRIEKRIHSGEELLSYADYYVAGIGLYKRTAGKRLELEVLSSQTYDPNVPVLN